MVSRRGVLPAGSGGQVAGGVLILASVTPGCSGAGAVRTAARAAVGSFCTAISRTPSRAAADSVPCTWKARPNSAMPRTRTMSSGTMRANSTAVAPRWSRNRFLMVLTASPCAATQRPPGREAAAPYSRDWARSGSGGLELVGDLDEQLVQLTAERHDGGDDHGGDQADHEA